MPKIDDKRSEIVNALKEEYNKAYLTDGFLHASIQEKYTELNKYKRWRESLSLVAAILTNGIAITFFVLINYHAQLNLLGSILVIIFAGLIVGLPLALFNSFLVRQTEKDKESRQLLIQHNEAIKTAISIVETKLR